jgi:hypothetical protein
VSEFPEDVLIILWRRDSLENKIPGVPMSLPTWYEGNHGQFIPEQIVGSRDYYHFRRCRVLFAFRADRCLRGPARHAHGAAQSRHGYADADPGMRIG